MRLMNPRRFPLLLAALLLSGQSSAQTDSSKPAAPTAKLHLPPAQAVGVAPAASDAGSRCRIRITSQQSGGRKTFSATEILDLDLRVNLRTDVTGDHLLHVKVRTPGGHLYQTLTTPFTTDAAKVGRERSVDGYPRPLIVQPARVENEGGRARISVLARLPVAGTAIVHSSLYGGWTAEAFLDNDDTSCGRVRPFVIQP